MIAAADSSNPLNVLALHVAAPNELDPLLPLLKTWKGASMTRTPLNIPCTSLLRQFSLSGALEWETEFGIDKNVTVSDASFWSLDDIRNFMPDRAAFALTVFNFIQRCKGIRNYAKHMYFSRVFFKRIRNYATFIYFSISLCTELTAVTAHRGHVSTASPPSSAAWNSVLGNVATLTHINQLHSYAAAVIESNTTTPAPAVPKETQICHGPLPALTDTLPPIPASLPLSRHTLIAPPSDFWISASSIVAAFDNFSRVPLHDPQVGNQDEYRQELADMKLKIEGWLRQSASRYP